MNARSNHRDGPGAKMLTVFDAAGFEQLIKPGDIVAIKIHCGEYNNTGLSAAGRIHAPWPTKSEGVGGAPVRVRYHKP